MKNLIKFLASYFFSPDQNVVVAHGIYQHPKTKNTKFTYSINGSKIESKIDQDKINAVFNKIDFDKLFNN